LSALVFVSETFEAQVANLQRLLLRVGVHRHVAWHVDPRRLPNQNLQLK
jgi:hypothetical protein